MLGVQVNIADILTRWTDGELRSTYHRVRSPDQATGEPLVRLFKITQYSNRHLLRRHLTSALAQLWLPPFLMFWLSKRENLCSTIHEYQQQVTMSYLDGMRLSAHAFCGVESQVQRPVKINVSSTSLKVRVFTAG